MAKRASVKSCRKHEPQNWFRRDVRKTEGLARHDRGPAVFVYFSAATKALAQGTPRAKRSDGEGLAPLADTCVNIV
jgi:hypothetical protein